MKKVIFLVFMFAVYTLSEELYVAKSSYYIQTAFSFADSKDKMIGKTQSVKELIGERKSINEFDLGFDVSDNKKGMKIYGSLWFGNADQYGIGFGIDGRYKPFQSIPISLVLGLDEKIGIGDNVFEQRNVTISAVNGGAPSMIYFTDDAKIDSTALKFGIELDISKHFTLTVAYVPRWDNYRIKYKEVGASIFRKDDEISWYEFHSVVQAGVAFRF